MRLIEKLVHSYDWKPESKASLTRLLKLYAKVVAELKGQKVKPRFSSRLASGAFFKVGQVLSLALTPPVHF